MDVELLWSDFAFREALEQVRKSLKKDETRAKFYLGVAIDRALALGRTTSPTVATRREAKPAIDKEYFDDKTPLSAQEVAEIDKAAAESKVANAQSMVEKTKRVAQIISKAFADSPGEPIVGIFIKPENWCHDMPERVSRLGVHCEMEGCGLDQKTGMLHVSLKR